jgi:hypothetical protein
MAVNLDGGKEAKSLLFITKSSPNCPEQIVLCDIRTWFRGQEMQ